MQGTCYESIYSGRGAVGVGGGGGVRGSRMEGRGRSLITLNNSGAFLKARPDLWLVWEL